MSKVANNYAMFALINEVSHWSNVVSWSKRLRAASLGDLLGLTTGCINTPLVFIDDLNSLISCSFSLTFFHHAILVVYICITVSIMWPIAPYSYNVTLCVKSLL